MARQADKMPDPLGEPSLHSLTVMRPPLASLLDHKPVRIQSPTKWILLLRWWNSVFNWLSIIKRPSQLVSSRTISALSRAYKRPCLARPRYVLFHGQKVGEAICDLYALKQMMSEKRKEFVATHSDEFIEDLIIVTKNSLVTESIINSENRPVTLGIF